MLVTRRSRWSGIERTIEIPVTEEQMLLWKSGALIQDAMPNLTSAQREFLMTGFTEEEWDEMFPDEEESDDVEQ